MECKKIVFSSATPTAFKLASMVIVLKSSRLLVSGFLFALSLCLEGTADVVLPEFLTCARKTLYVICRHRARKCCWRFFSIENTGWPFFAYENTTEHVDQTGSSQVQLTVRLTHRLCWEFAGCHRFSHISGVKCFQCQRNRGCAVFKLQL